ncbi:MAG TPA: hypothetical protein VFT74_09080, partial [Isosphaeraceae bacterium]|nr:hypothetical protein [Isosphaeraceae bacterium]
MSSISIEQAVYGSFPFWERGYAVLGRSPGCRDEWVEAFTSACTRFGERPREVSRAAGLFALRAGSEVWMIVGVRGQGEDDQGRPGALAFHALFVSDADYRRCGASPFPFARWHREDWGPETGSLPSLSVSIRGLEDETPATLASRQADLDSRAGRVARVLSRGRRVAVVADRPIDDLAQAVWGALSVRQKGQKTLATWAFGVGNGFDLVGLPERPNLVMPEGYVGEADLEERPRPAPSRPAGRTWAVWRSAGLLAAAVGLSALAGAWYARTGSRVERIEPERESVAVEPETPEPPAVRPVSIDQEARRRITERLRDLSHRFGIGTGE